MPVDKVKVQHKFGIISHNHRQNLLDRISVPPSPVGFVKRQLPCEITHEFINSYNNSHPLDRKQLDVLASQLLLRVKRRSGLLSGGIGKHVHIPRSWVELTLLARCQGPFREQVLEVLLASLMVAPPSIDNIPSLFLLSETVVEWIKQLGNPVPETAWTKVQILILYIAELCFWRIYYHSLLHHLQGCDSFLSDLSWHIENMDFVRKAYFKFPDGEMLLRQMEQVKLIISEIFEKKTESKSSEITAGLMHGLDFFNSIRAGGDSTQTLSSLLTTLSLLGTEGTLPTCLTWQLLTNIACRDVLSLQIIQAAGTGTLPLQEGQGVCHQHVTLWPWNCAVEFVELLLTVAMRGRTSEIQRSAIKAGEMSAVRVDGRPVSGIGLLDLVGMSGKLSPAVQYSLQQALARLHIHVSNDPLRKSATHLIWSALQGLNRLPSHRVVVGIAQNKSASSEAARAHISPGSKLVFEQMFDALSDHFLPATVTTTSTTTAPTTAYSTPRKTPRTKRTGSSTTPPKHNPVPATTSKTSKLSVELDPGAAVEIEATSSQKQFTKPKFEPYRERNNKILQDIVTDQWYKELMNVFRASEKAHQSVEECDEYSVAEKTYAQHFVEDVDLSKSDVCVTMDKLVVNE